MLQQRLAISAPSGAPSAPGAAVVAPTAGAARQDDVPPLALPGTHFALALGALALGALGLVAVAPELARGEVFSPRLLAVVHLFTLGWITTSILGALCQFLPVAVGVPIRSQRAAYLTLALHGTGLALFVGGLVAGTPAVFRAGAIAVSIALTIFVANLALTLARARARDVTFFALALACAFLAATLVLGVLLAWNLHSGLLGASRLTMLAVHVHVALGGWVLLVAIGVGHRLLPMFLLSHGASEVPARAAVALVGLGATLLLAVPAALGRIAGGVCMALGACAFLVQAALFAKHRRRREIDPGMRLALGGLAGLGATVLVAPFALGHGLSSPRLLVAYFFLAIVAAISAFVAGHYYKIVPFLVWFHRYGPLVGERAVPKVAELFSARGARTAGALFAAGTCAALAGIALGSEPLVRAGALGLVAAVAIEIAQMTQIARRRPT